MRPYFCSSSSTGRRRRMPTLAVVCAVAGFIAYRDVKLSAEVMLWIEAVSVGLIVIVLRLLPVHIGLQLDTSQFQSQGRFVLIAGAGAGALHLQLCRI